MGGLTFSAGPLSCGARWPLAAGFFGDALAMKKDTHPEYYPECKITYRGEVVMTVGATVPEMNVEIWSGSHPFYTGKSSFVDTAGRVEKFQNKFKGDYFKNKKKKK